MDYNNDELQFENLSGDESIEEEDRTSEIKQLLAQAFSNESFDDESEHSFLANDSDRSSNINGHEVVDKIIFHRNNNEKEDTSKKTMAENGLHSFFNGIGLEKGDGHHNGGGRVNGSKKVRFQSISPIKGNDNDSSSSTTTSTTTSSTVQQNRGTDEIEESNPTISLLHQNHCPQNGDDDVGSDIWTESGNVIERLKTICQLRERQVQRAEENIKALNKDKRSLNHHIGLMKTEMIQMKSCQDELQKTIELRDEEIKYLKSRMTEGIGEEVQKREETTENEYEEVQKREETTENEYEEVQKREETTENEYEEVQKREETTEKECEGYKDQVKFCEKAVEDYQRQLRIYEKEVEDYKTKLVALPSQLYKEWKNQQEEIGLLYGGNPKSSSIYNTFSGRKHCRDIGIVTDPISHLSMAMQPNTGSSSQTLGEKECSSVVIQTDETLETYQVLGNLIEQWAKEVAESSKRAEVAEREVSLTQTKLFRLKNKFQDYHKQTLACRKKWHEQEKLLCQKYEDSRAECIAILSKVSDQLDIDIYYN